MGLDNPWPLALKAASAAMLAYLLCLTLDLPDGLSAAFVAVVCVSPTVLAGLRRALGQGLASLLGGGLAAALMVAGVPTVASLGLSVAGAILAVFALGFSRAHTVAAFTAIYMHLLPLGEPGQTLGIRVSAVAVGAMAAMAVNTLVSAMFYERIFARRLERVAETVAKGADGICAGHFGAMVPAFEQLSALSAELVAAQRELSWRRNAELGTLVAKRRHRVRGLLRVAHFAHDLALVVEDSGTRLKPTDVALLKHVAARLRGQPTDPPVDLGEIGWRVLAALKNAT